MKILFSITCTASVLLITQPANAALPLVSACTGASLPQSRLTSILTPLVTGIYTPLIGLPVVGPTLLAGVGGIVTGALSGAPIGLDVLKVGGGVLAPGAQCSQQADGFTIAVAKGLTIGGNSIDGLGANGLSANAGEIGSIALGNSASTGALATTSIAIGSGANVTGASSNAIAIGTTASAQGASATAIGSGAQALGVSTVAIGTAATATAAQQVAIGQAAGVGAGLGATGVVSLGYAAGTNVQGAQNVGIGAGAGVFTGAGTGVSGARNVAIGSTDAVVAAAGTGVSGDDNVAIGTGAGLAVTNAGTVSIGRNARGSATGAVALGTGATTNVANSVALGSGSTITGAPTGLAFQTATAAPASQVEVGGRRITGVSGGAAPTDAVNVSQLLGTANNLATTLGGSFNAAGAYTPPTYTTAAGTTATTVQGALANETAATTQLGNAAAANVGAGATYTPATGVLSAPSFSVANISATGAVGAPTVATNTGAAVAGLSTDVTNLANGLTSGAIGLVQQAVAAAPITVGATTGGTSVDFTGTAGTRRLTGVTTGVAATDAANVGQVTAAVGAATANEVQYDAPGGIRANSVTLVGGLPGTVTVTNVAPGSLVTGSTDAVNGSQLAATNTNVTNNTTSITNLNNGTAGLVQQALAGAPITVGATTGGTSVDLTGTSGPRRLSGVGAGLVATDAVNLGQVTAAVGTATANGVQYDAPGGIRANSVTLVGGVPGTVTITNLAPGSLAAGSTDAVNGSQLAATNTNVTNNTTSITNLNNGTAGLVQQALAGAPITVGATTGGTSVDFTGTTGARRLSGVDAGVAATDAVNLAQVGNLIGTSARSSPLQYSDPAAATVPTPGVVSNSTTLVGLTPGAVVALHNVAVGALSAGSTDAVNGSQLFASNAAIDAQGAIVNGLGFGVAGQLGGGTVYNPITGALGGGTYRAGTTGGTYTTVAAALANIVTGPEGSDPSAVHYTDATHTAIVLGNAGAAPVGIANVADGNIAAGSHDAVTGGQLATTNANVRANSTAVTNLTNQIADGTVGLVQQTGGPGAGAITIGAGTAGTVISAANNAGAARRLTAVAAGAVNAASVDAINGSQLFAVSQAQTAANALSVQYTADAAGNPTAAIDLTKGGTIAATTVSGVAAGAVTTASTQAVNGAQLYSTNAHVAGDTAALGGGAAYNAATGTYTSPTYTVQGAAVNTVGGAVAALDSAVGRALTATASGVRYDDATRTSLTLNAGGPATALHNVAPGVAAGDAVNVAQLQSASNATLASAEGYTDQHVAALSYDLRRRVDATGAKGAALAGVPQSINPGSGFVGASVGGQGAEVAFALGVSKVFDAAHLPVIKAGVSVDARGYSASYNVGAGFHF